MHPEDLKTVWLCCECRRNFLFHSDVEDHKRQFNHSKVMLRNISDTAGRASTLFVRGRISMSFKLNSSSRASRIIIEYQYYPSTGNIQYVNVVYSDEKLQSRIESDPEMMKNIDNYLRKILNKPSASPQRAI